MKSFDTQKISLEFSFADYKVKYDGQDITLSECDTDMLVMIGILYMLTNTAFTHDLKSAMKAIESKLESKQKAQKNDVEHNE